MTTLLELQGRRRLLTIAFFWPAAAIVLGATDVAPDEEETSRAARLEAQGKALEERLAETAIDHELWMKELERHAEAKGTRWVAGSKGWFRMRSVQAALVWDAPAAEDPDRLVGQQRKAADHPFPVVLSFARQMARKGVECLFVPVPSKLNVYPEELVGAELEHTYGHAPGTRAFLRELNSSGVETVDLFTPLSMQRAYGEEIDPVFLRSDPHWTPRGARIAAKAVADALLRMPTIEPGPLAENQDYFLRAATRSFSADDEVRAPDPASEMLHFQRVLDEDGLAFKPRDRNSPIVVIGDSFVDFHKALGAHFAAYLAVETGHKVDTISIRGGGVLQVRNSLRIRNDKMKGKKVIVWLLSGQALRPSDRWQPMTMFR